MPDAHFLANVVLVGLVLISYMPLVLWKKSFMYKLINKRFTTDWDEESQAGAKQFANISAVLAAISLATVPFAWSILPEDLLQKLLENPYDIMGVVGIMGIAGILSSSVLFFWALGFSYNAGVATKPSPKDDEPRMPQKSYKSGYYMGTFGVFLFFSGLIWTLNSVSPLLTTISAGMYFFILFVAGLTFWRS